MDEPAHSRRHEVEAHIDVIVEARLRAWGRMAAATIPAIPAGNAGIAAGRTTLATICSMVGWDGSFPGRSVLIEIWYGRRWSSAKGALSHQFTKVVADDIPCPDLD